MPIQLRQPAVLLCSEVNAALQDPAAHGDERKTRKGPSDLPQPSRALVSERRLVAYLSSITPSGGEGSTFYPPEEVGIIRLTVCRSRLTVLTVTTPWTQTSCSEAVTPKPIGDAGMSTSGMSTPGTVPDSKTRLIIVK